MIQITCGTCGTSQGYKTAANGVLSLTAAEEKRLVSRGVAEYVTRPIISADTNTGDPAIPDVPSGTFASQAGESLRSIIAKMSAPAPPSGGEEPQDTTGDEPLSEAATDGGEDDSDAAEVVRLERMQRPDLEQMAADLGVDAAAISGAKNKHDLAVLIVAAGESDDGDTPPDLGAGDIVQ